MQGQENKLAGLGPSNSLERAQSAMSNSLTNSGSVREGPTPEERHYAPSEVAELWNLSVEAMRCLFQDEPGVVVLQAPVKKGRRPYKTIRIPQSVLERVHKRLQR
jgi:hypothetical protein